MFGKKKKEKSSFSSIIRDFFCSTTLDSDFFEKLEDTLIEADVGSAPTVSISDELQSRVKSKRLNQKEEILSELKAILSESITVDPLKLEEDKLNLFIVLGVNGVGKTTTIAKLATYYQNSQNTNTVLAAADTFRAAAIDQLKFHGEKINIQVVAHQHGSDPASVIYDAIESAIAKERQLVIADTAGRMHTKANLIGELQKIVRVASKFNRPIAIKKIFVLDATTGQNGFAQATIFHEAVGIDAIILSKYDSLSKGGNIVSISRQLSIPVSFVGVGEKYGDLLPFNKEEFLTNLVGN